MIRAIAGAAGLMLLLAGCDGGAAPTKTKSIAVARDNPVHERLLQLDARDRGLGLRRAILDTGNRCKTVTASAQQGVYKNMPMWTARCSDSGDWAVFIQHDGGVQVRACKDAATLGLPACALGKAD